MSSNRPIGRTRARRTEDAIVDATRKLLAERGASMVTMRDVADECGITAAAIYRHVKSKQALITRVVDESFAEFERALWREIAPLPVGSFARLATLGEAYIRFACERPEHFRVLFDPWMKTPRNIEEIEGRGGYDILRQCVVEAIASGELRDEDPDLISLFLWTRVHGIASLFLSCGFGSLRPKWGKADAPMRLFRETRDFILHGLRRHT